MTRAAWFAFPLLALAAPKPMTFLDVLSIKTPSAGTLSKDGKWFAYTVSSLDWKAGKRYTELWLTETATGATRQITFTRDRNESAPAFAPDSASLAFLSDRDGATPTNQVFLLSLAGGEARKVSDVAGGVSSFAFRPDGTMLAMLGGRGEAKQIHFWRTGSQDRAKPLFRHASGVDKFAWSPGGERVYFTAPDSLSASEKARMDLKFDVRIVDQPNPPKHLWEAAVDDPKPRRLTSGGEFTVNEFNVAKSGDWVAFLSASTDRHEEGGGSRKREAWLLHAPTAKVERLTDNSVSETAPIVSPDGKWVAMTAPDGFEFFRRLRIYLRPTAGGAWRKVPGDEWDHDPTGLIWAKDSERIYFEAGIGTGSHAVALDVASGKPRQITTGDRDVDLTYHPETNQFIVAAQDSTHPVDYWLAKDMSEAASPASWKRLSNANPDIGAFVMGQRETVRWKSTDGAMVEGILTRPAGYERGKRYPLLVQVHGGPASATVHRFPGSYSTYDHLYAARGYAVLHPNYRGSTNYGEKFKTSIAGRYFPQAFDDIMTGVDWLIAEGIADPDQLGMMGWSAGGHWSNWTLTHTNRFKAISSGAGAMNWVSMYAQNDTQAVRENYFGGKPYDNWDHWVEMSPIKHIKNARTPTLIHCGHDDPRVPRPQSEELHMALKKLGVPTEFIVYPRMGHGLTEPRYQYVKMAAEFAWFEKWIRGKKEWLDWKEIAATVPKDDAN